MGEYEITRRRLLRGIAVAPISLRLTSAYANQITDDAEPFTITSTVERVLLDVSVKDSRGGYVTGLERGNFQVFENGRPEPITDFASVDTPVTVGLVVDASGSMRSKRAEVITAGLAFAKESNPQDEFFVINFNNYVTAGLPHGMDFTDNVQILRSALYMGNPIGQTALYDAVITALTHLRKGKQAKKTLIVVSDGGDNVSKAGQSDVIKLLQASETTVYTVGLFSSEDRDRNPRALRKLAHLSGGEYYNPKELDDVVPVFHQIAVDIRKRYLLGFAPDPQLDPAKYPIRSIRVTAVSPGRAKLIAHYRTSYSLQPFAQLLAKERLN